MPSRRHIAKCAQQVISSSIHEHQFHGIRLERLQDRSYIREHGGSSPAPSHRLPYLRTVDSHVAWGSETAPLGSMGSCCWSRKTNESKDADESRAR